MICEAQSRRWTFRCRYAGAVQCCARPRLCARSRRKRASCRRSWLRRPTTESRAELKAQFSRLKNTLRPNRRHRFLRRERASSRRWAASRPGAGPRRSKQSSRMRAISAPASTREPQRPRLGDAHRRACRPHRLRVAGAPIHRQAARRSSSSRRKATCPQPNELRFDMFDAEFTHEGDRCSFEVLLARIGLDDPALTAIAEIVHDIDLKDEKFGREEAAGHQDADQRHLRRYARRRRTARPRRRDFRRSLRRLQPQARREDGAQDGELGCSANAGS